MSQAKRVFSIVLVMGFLTSVVAAFAVFHPGSGITLNPDRNAIPPASAESVLDELEAYAAESEKTLTRRSHVRGSKRVPARIHDDLHLADRGACYEVTVFYSDPDVYRPSHFFLKRTEHNFFVVCDDKVCYWAEGYVHSEGRRGMSQLSTLMNDLKGIVDQAEDGRQYEYEPEASSE